MTRMTNFIISFFKKILGLCAGIQKSVFEFLQQVQKKLVKVIKSVGKIDHDFWRSFHNERKTEPSVGTIDGDLIESCLDLTRDQLKDVVDGLQVSLSTLYFIYCIFNGFCSRKNFKMQLRWSEFIEFNIQFECYICLLYTSPSPRDS